MRGFTVSPRGRAHPAGSPSSSVSQSVSYFTVPPRAHPSAVSPSGSAAPGQTQVPSDAAPGQPQVPSTRSQGLLNFRKSGFSLPACRVIPVAFCPVLLGRDCVRHSGGGDGGWGWGVSGEGGGKCFVHAIISDRRSDSRGTLWSSAGGSSCVHVSVESFTQGRNSAYVHTSRNTQAHSRQCLRRTCTHIYDHATAETRILSVHLVKAAQTLERRLAVREATATGAVVGELIVLEDRRRIERLCR